MTTQQIYVVGISYSDGYTYNSDSCEVVTDDATTAEYIYVSLQELLEKANLSGLDQNFEEFGLDIKVEPHGETSIFMRTMPALMTIRL